MTPRSSTGLRLLIASVGAVAALSAQQASAPPQQPPTFRAGLVTVAVPATIVDATGELVTTLDRSDFTVFDDGAPQEITTFVSGLQPIVAAVLVDTSASMTSGFALALQGAEQLIIRLRPDDLAFVGTFNHRIDFSGEATADRDRLLRYLRDPGYGNPTRLYDAIDQALTRLLPLGGRRVIVPFTDGCDTASDTRWDLVRARLRSEDVMVYPVRVRSRVNYSSEYLRKSRGVTECQRQADLELPTAGSFTDIVRANDPRRITTPGEIFDHLAGETGGGQLTLAGSDEINPIFTSVMAELHYAYVIGFTTKKTDGKVHSLRVALKDRKLLIRARRSYQAPLSGSAPGQK